MRVTPAPRWFTCFRTIRSKNAATRTTVNTHLDVECGVHRSSQIWYVCNGNSVNDKLNGGLCVTPTTGSWELRNLFWERVDTRVLVRRCELSSNESQGRILGRTPRRPKGDLFTKLCVKCARLLLTMGEDRGCYGCDRVVRF